MIKKILLIPYFPDERWLIFDLNYKK